LKDIGKIIFYFAGTILLGALLAPPLFWSAHYLADQFNITAMQQFLAGTDFQRFFNRAVLVAAVLMIWPTVKWLRIRSLQDLGLQPDPARWRHLGIGFAIACGSLVLLGAGLIFADLYKLKEPLPIHRLTGVLMTAAVVAVLEETLFRGAIQGLVQRTTSKWTALFFVSAIFSIIHFLKPREDLVPHSDVTWSSGFALIPHAFWQFQEPLLVAGGFATIFLVGLIAGYARLRTNALWLSIGLHAGWIFGKMGFSKLTKRTGSAWPWFGNDLLVGLGPVCVVLLTGVVVWCWLNYADRKKRV
jgi:uncharacterized protein